MTELGTALRTLTEDQPAQPVDRLGAVTGRARRIRRTRAAVSVAAVLAVAAPVGLVLTQGGGSTQRQQYAGTRITSWPDRSLAKDRGVADGAVLSYTETKRGFGEQVGDRPRWLFRGTVSAPDGDDMYVAVYLIEHDGKNVVVTSSTRRRQVDAHGIDLEDPDGLSKGSSPWVDREQEVSKDLDHVGTYVQYGSESYGDVLFVLAAPSARALTWQQHPLPAAPVAAGQKVAMTGSARSGNGVFTTDAGPLVGPVTIALEDASGSALTAQDEPLSELSTPGLSKSLPVELPAGWTPETGVTAQSERQGDGSWSGLASANYSAVLQGGRTVAVLARCYGGGSVLFTLSRDESDASALARGRVSCDGDQHEVLRHEVPANGYEVRVGNADRLVALTWQSAVVGRP
jgi:hypothetical protein